MIPLPCEVCGRPAACADCKRCADRACNAGCINCRPVEEWDPISRGLNRFGRWLFREER